MSIVKWWKSKTVLTIYGMVLFIMIVSFLLAYFLHNPFNWILSSIVALLGGYGIKRYIFKKLDEKFKNFKIDLE